MANQRDPEVNQPFSLARAENHVLITAAACLGHPRLSRPYHWGCLRPIRHARVLPPGAVPLLPCRHPLRASIGAPGTMRQHRPFGTPMIPDRRNRLQARPIASRPPPVGQARRQKIPANQGGPAKPRSVRLPLCPMSTQPPAHRESPPRPPTPESLSTNSWSTLPLPARLSAWVGGPRSAGRILCPVLCLGRGWAIPCRAGLS